MPKLARLQLVHNRYDDTAVIRRWHSQPKWCNHLTGFRFEEQFLCLFILRAFMHLENGVCCRRLFRISILLRSSGSGYGSREYDVVDGNNFVFLFYFLHNFQFSITRRHSIESTSIWNVLPISVARCNWLLCMWWVCVCESSSLLRSIHFIFEKTVNSN